MFAVGQWRSLLGTLTGSPGYYPLLNGSPAINAASADHCPDTDQAGLSRPWPAGGACDIGAYEAQFDSSSATATNLPTATATSTPTATNTPRPHNVRLNGTACHLADAITAANTDTATGSCPAGSGSDTITFAMNITLSDELPTIVSNITLDGEDFTIDGDGKYRIFWVNSGTVNINRLTLTNGSRASGGAALTSYGTLDISDSIISNNAGSAILIMQGTLNVAGTTFSGNGAASAGSAIYNSWVGTATITNSRFENNTANNGSGGAIYNYGKISISNSVFHNNSSARGGAISSLTVAPPPESANVTISNSTFSNNSAISSTHPAYLNGGAIFNLAATLTISGSAFKDNSAMKGGAIYDEALGTGGNWVTVTNSTFSGNSASEIGGTAYLVSGSNSKFFHVTIANNTAPNVGGIFQAPSSNDRHNHNIYNSIIAGNGGGDCSVQWTTNVSSLIKDGTCSPALTGDPILGTLTGSPGYYPLLNGSPAINAANRDHCLDTDQAGRSRPWPAGGACDIGAYEAQFDPSITTATATLTPTETATATNTAAPTATNTPSPFNVTLNGTACHLDDAITAANGDTATGSCPAGSGDDTIILTSDITLSARLPNITSTITIEGAGHFISGNNTYRSFYVEPAGNLTINQLQLKHGSESDGGAILNYFGTLAVTNSRFDSNSVIRFGGAIASFGGTTTITSSRFSNNSSANKAGALYTHNSGRLTVTSSTLVSNSADGAGGAIAVTGQTTINSSKLNDNSSPHGGAIWSRALSYINNSEISNNSSTRDGGAIYATGITLEVTNSTITGNSASRYGGAVFVHESIARVDLKHVTVANNSAANGGGVYKEAGGTLNLHNSIVAGSTSGGDCVGGLDGNVNNLIQDNSCSPSVSGDPILGTLTGLPGYYPLLNGSPAINAAHGDHCLDTDQAGLSRPWPAGGACDIGAYEVQFDPSSATATTTPTSAPTSTPTPRPFNVTLNGSACHLDDAITAANTDTATGSCPAGSGADTIELIADITLEALLPRIRSEIVINGDGYAIDGAGQYYMFFVSRLRSLTIDNLTMKNGFSPGDGGAIVNRSGELTVRNSNFSQNAADHGGAIHHTGKLLSIENSIFSSNSATTAGGAIDSEGAFPSTYTISRSTFNNNSTTSWGGAINMAGNLMTASISNNTFSANSARWAGALYTHAWSSTISITNNTFYGNSTTDSASSAFFVSGSPSLIVNLQNNIIAGSTGADCGGYEPVDQNVANLIEDGTCSPAISGDPLLGELTGSPAYYPLLGGSPANGAAYADYCPDTDQAGNARPSPAGTACDIGAYESDYVFPTATSTPTATATVTPTNTPTATATATPEDLCVTAGSGANGLFPASGTDQVFTHVKYVRSPATHVIVLNEAGDGGFWWPRATGCPTALSQIAGPNPEDLSRSRSWHNVWEHIYTVAGQDTAVNLRLRDNSVWLGGYTSLQDALNFLQLVVDEDAFNAGVNDYYYGLNIANNDTFGIRKIVTFTPGDVQASTNTATATATPTDTPTFTATPTPTVTLGLGATTDRAALVEFYNATVGDNWTDNTNWLSDLPLGDWYGITTNANGRVTAIELSNNLLDGTLPNSIGDLSELRTLDLSLEPPRRQWRAGWRNSRHIRQPVEAGNIGLEGQLLHRPYSDQRWATLPTLQGAGVPPDYNELSGSIPTALGNLAKPANICI